VRGERELCHAGVLQRPVARAAPEQLAARGPAVRRQRRPEEVARHAVGLDHRVRVADQQAERQAGEDIARVIAAGEGFARSLHRISAY